ncbi:DinB family protein [Arcicella sp. DC2W]|uniref:DinB family protein n=1 Tax=Arcicella gelida TaxID=2984195 RepID=A0ABU5S0B7_9BACT|nr:DinB family protein [Arcicella sp. DC2W]MEA5401914.1 DinB family protein [Arcicella sp. DC2W]
MEEIVAQLSNRISTVEQYFSERSEADLSAKASPEKWSKKEVLGHLIDSAQSNIRRMVVGQYQENAHIIYRQNEWVKAADYQHYDTKDLIQMWVLLNKHFCRILLNLPKENYQTITNWGNETTPMLGQDLVTLEFVAKDYVRHLDHHLKQIF